jgi:predicted ArsR family transcriptional regulator
MKPPLDRSSGRRKPRHADEVILQAMSQRRPLDANELGRMLGLSASYARARLLRLHDAGSLVRIRRHDGSLGQPSWAYYVPRGERDI